MAAGSGNANHRVPEKGVVGEAGDVHPGQTKKVTLTLPAGYEPGRKYPMVVYFYEELPDGDYADGWRSDSQRTRTRIHRRRCAGPCLPSSPICHRIRSCACGMITTIANRKPASQNR